MDKLTFLKLALKAGNYRYLDWIFSIFCLTKDTEKSKLNYAFKVTADPTGYYFTDQSGQVIKITDAIPNVPLFTVKDRIEINPDDIPNLKETVETNIGRLIANYILLVEPFGKKIDYINTKFGIGTVEEIILKYLKNDPENEEDKKENEIYVSEYLKFSESAFYLTGFTQVVTWGATERIMLPPDGLAEYKAQLLEEYKDRLTDAAAIAEIDAKLIAFDKEYLKGDSGMNFLISKKSTDKVRKKKFLMHGAEVGLDGNTVNVTLIQNSLNEGWDVNNFPVMNNSLRSGSYSRGAETMLGGVEVKWLLRASSNIAVPEDDCGSTIGIPIDITDSNYKSLVGFNVITRNGSILVENEEQATQYINKKIMTRSPMFCKLEQSNFCKKCIGKNLSENPNALSTAISAYGSAFLAASLGAMHGKTLEVAKMNIETALF